MTNEFALISKNPLIAVKREPVWLRICDETVYLHTSAQMDDLSHVPPNNKI